MGFIAQNPAMSLPEQGGTVERIHPVIRLLPSLTNVCVILTLVFLFSCMGGTHSLLGDGDTGWHIRTGQWILANHSVPHHDVFSYTMPGTPWFAWEWLWDLVFAGIYNCSGLAGVVLVSLAVLCVTMPLLFRLTRRKCGNVLIAFAVAMVAIAGSTLHWLARPHLFTLLFGAIFYLMLERAQDAFDAGDGARARRLLWILPPLTILWTNLHAGFVFGISLIGCYGAGEIACWLIGSEGERLAAWARAWRYLLTASACLLASLVNPYFYSLHQHMFSYLHDKYTFEHILEFQSVSFHSPMAWAWELMILLGAISVFRDLARKQFVYVFLLLFWGHMGLVSGRNIPLFMLVAAPIVARNLAEIFSSLANAPVAVWLRRASLSIERLAANVDETDRIGRFHLISVLAFALVAALIYAPQPPVKFQAEYDPKKYPAKALEFLGGPGIQNRIFADDEWGDYLLYRLYPTKVFIDGRSDMYGDKFCLKYIDIFNVKYDWEQSLAHYKVDTVLLSTEAPLAGAIKESRNWRVVYDDGLAIVFRPAALSARPGEKISAVQPDRGTGRDRKITKSEGRDRKITKTTT